MSKFTVGGDVRDDMPVKHLEMRKTFLCLTTKTPESVCVPVCVKYVIYCFINVCRNGVLDKQASLSTELVTFTNTKSLTSNKVQLLKCAAIFILNTRRFWTKPFRDF